jgi:predicted RNase H-like HicB family nuclease
MKYLVVVECGKNGWGAYVPDLPGCIAAGKTREEALRLIREAIAFHVEGLQEAGEAIPSPSSEGEVVDVDAA